MAYLDFLKKHAPPLPSRQSMACSLAFLVMQREILAASLLSGSPALSSDVMESKSHSGTMDLILDTLCEALETGTVSDETASVSRMVTLASPQYLGNEQVVRRVSLHKVVVGFFALKYGKGHEVKQGFSRLLNCFFPDTRLSVAWLENRNGEDAFTHRGSSTSCTMQYAKAHTCK